MAIPERRKTAVLIGSDRIGVIEEQIPDLLPGHVLIEVHRSLISPGSELGGWSSFSQRYKNRNGATGSPKPFGYSNSGIVLAVGEGVDNLHPGQRVAAIGAGKALHTTHARVPVNLCVALPDAVSFEQGSYAMLLATALHGLRRAKPELGESFAVVGLGLLGQLCARLLQLNGCRAIGWDSVTARTALASRFCVDAIANAGEELSSINQFTGGAGIDGALLSINGDGEAVYDTIMQAMKCSSDGHPMGRIVLVGHTQFPVKTRPMSNVDILMASRTGAGYHDATWEQGANYPAGHMRWTTKTNLELCMRLVAEGKISVEQLTTHRIALATLTESLDSLLAAPDDVLGVVLEMR